MAAISARQRRGSGAAAAVLLAAAALAGLPAAFVGLAAAPAARPIAAMRGAALAARGGEEELFEASSFAAGSKVNGVVKRLVPYGAFVDIGAEVEGLLHISQISGQRIEDVWSVLEEGQEVEVWIQRNADGKIALTRLEENAKPQAPVDLAPFAAADAGEWHDGVVKRVLGFGAIVSVTLSDSDATAEGLVHVSQIKDSFVDDIDAEVQSGQTVRVRVLAADQATGRMSLSMKEPVKREESPQADLTPFEDIAEDQWLDGKVESIARFGAFVNVAAPGMEEQARGLVHVTQITGEYVERVEDAVQVGDDVKVRVVSVNVPDGKLGLSMVPPGEDPPDEDEGF